MAKSSSFPNRINKETSNVESSIELTKVEKDIVSDDTGKKSVLSAFKQINNINNGGSTNNHNDSGGGSTAGIV